VRQSEEEQGASMSDGQDQPPRTGRPLRDYADPQRGSSSDPNSQPGNGGGAGGLLSRHRAGASPSDDAANPADGERAPRPSAPSTPRPPTPSAPRNGHRPGSLLARFGAAGEALENLTSEVKRVAQDAVNRVRRPVPGDWRASDYAPGELDALLDSAEWNDPDRSRQQRAPERNAPRGQRAATGRGGPVDWEHDWDAGWETGTWDTSWATGFSPSASEASGAWGATGGWGDTGEYGEDEWSRSLVALGAVSLAEIPMSRLRRVRLVLSERTAASTMLLVFLVGFALTCLAPLLPMLRLTSDLLDLAVRANHIQSVLKGGAQQVLQPTKLAIVQEDVHSIEQDLYEINAVTNVVGAPGAAVSHSVANYRLLMRMGFDLTAAGDEGLQVAQTLLVPLQGGALAASDTTPGITPNDIHRARAVLADAKTRVADAVAAYQQLDLKALPSSLKPGSKYGNYLALLPTAEGLFGEMDTLMAVAPALLGIGQPAQYLVIVMDRSELRPGGGFQGNYGILSLVGGKQPQANPLGLKNTYDLDTAYYLANLAPGADHKTAVDNCTLWKDNAIGGPSADYVGPEPPNYYWWWPVRNFSWCFNWGLRDANLSGDFPTNARTAMSIVQGTPGQLPFAGQLQGVAAFTPAFIEDLLSVPGVGPLKLSQYPNDPPITAANLENEIHCHQLYNPTCPQPPQTAGAPQTDRKEFTHLLSTALLAKIKTLHGSGLKSVVDAAIKAMRSKDLQVYFADPRVELILQQLGLASQIHTGNGDGFFVVDANDGGNKSNAYVTKHSEDLVTLLPNGGAIHRLKITTTYDWQGWVYADPGTPEDYNAVMRVYMPGDATILGYDIERPGSVNGFAIAPSCTGIYIDNCNLLPHPLNFCGLASHCLDYPVTFSDVPGRTMVMGLLDVACYQDADGQPVYYLQTGNAFIGGVACNLKPHVNHETVSIEWYTPNAWTPSSAGHGTYSELIEKQPGTEGANATTGVVSSTVSATVLIDLSQLHGGTLQGVDWTDLDLRAQALKGATKAFDGPIDADTDVSFSF
jgi:hypothetical protein